MIVQKPYVAIAGVLASSLTPFCLWPLSIVSAQDLPTIELAEAGQPLPEPPRTPPPNNTRPGGGLGPDDSSCNAQNTDLRALIPVENPVLTTTAYPTFLFYVPFGAEAIQFGEFSLLHWPGEETRHYKTRFALPESPGIVSVTIPEIPAYALAEEHSYRWYFQLYCDGGDGIQPDLTLEGSVQRVALTPERSQKIQSASPEIWYDALASVASRVQSSPQDNQLQATWRELLLSVDAEDAITTAFVGPILPLEER